jgi:uncharacterized membrane protein
MDFMSGLEAVTRWLHVLVGVLWIGHLYFFNFVNAPTQTKLDAAAKKAVVPEMMPRALYWFRWGAAWTWITGVLLLLLVYYHVNNTTEGGFGTGAMVMILVTFVAFFAYDALYKSPLAANVRAATVVSFLLLAAVVFLYVSWGRFTYRGMLIHTGTLFGTIMASNVWFRIWPAQQKIIRAVKNGEAPDGDLVKLAGLRSRHNTYMSLPLFFAMIGQHTTFFAGGNLTPASLAWMVWLVVIVIGWHIIFQLYKKSGKVEGF